MGVIAEFTISSADFALGQALEAVPAMVVDVERVVATRRDRVMPYFWVTGAAEADVEAAIRSDPSVREATVVDATEQGVLYRGEWTENVESLVYACTNIGATILRATGHGDQWKFELRFDDHETVTEFSDYCDENDVAFELDRLYEREEPIASAQYGLTPKQRETLVTAFKLGYFDVPQRNTMDDIADEISISQQAVSKRLRRGHSNLIRSTLIVGSPNDK